MDMKPNLRGQGTVFNGSLLDRLRARVVATVAERIDARRRDQRDHAVIRARVPVNEEAK
jgi:hypothetical protein